MSNTELVVGFRRLRPSVHAWLARDLTGPPLEYTSAYADLMFAYAYARLGASEDAHGIIHAAKDVLSTSASDVHRWLLGMFRYRIDEALAGKPPSLHPPTELEPPAYASSLPLDKQREVYTANAFRASSRILDPFHVVDQYAAWTNAERDKMGQRIVRLRSLRDPSRIESEIRELIGEADRLQAWERVAVWAGILSLAGCVGHRFAADLVIQVPGCVLPLLSAPIDKNVHFTRGLRELLSSAIELSARYSDGGVFSPLLTTSVAFFRNLTNLEARHSALIALAWPSLRRFCRLNALEEAERFLQDTRDFWPDMDNLLPEPQSNADSFAVLLRAIVARSALVGSPVRRSEHSLGWRRR